MYKQEQEAVFGHLHLVLALLERAVDADRQHVGAVVCTVCVLLGYREGVRSLDGREVGDRGRLDGGGGNLRLRWRWRRHRRLWVHR